MTQTQIAGSLDPDRSDRGLTTAQTQTPAEALAQTLGSTQTQTFAQTPDAGLSADGLGCSTQTQTPQTQTPQTVHLNPPPEIIAAGLASERSTAQTAQTQTGQTLGRAARAVGGAKAWLGGGGYLFALTAVVSVVASLGQKEFAESKAKFTNQIKIFGFDFTPWFAPAVFDLAVAALLHGGLLAARKRLSPWPWWICGAGVAAASTVTNAMHDGAEITAPASAVLFLIWGLHLYVEYRLIVRARESEDANAEEFLQTDVLFAGDRDERRLAEHAWKIARARDIPQGLAYRRSQGELIITGRGVALRAAKIFLDILDDELELLMSGRDVDENGQVLKDDKAKPVRWWQRSRRARALRLALLTANDAVDGYLGNPLPDRRGVVRSRVTYAPPPPPAPPALPEPPAVRRRALPPPDESDDEQPVGQVPAPRRRRALADRPEKLAEDQDDDGQDDAEPGKPGGVAGANWMGMEDLVRATQVVVLGDQQVAVDPLPADLDTTTCLCHLNPAKRCNRPLAVHVQRRGKQIAAIMQAVPNWATREAPISKAVVQDVLRITGVETLNQIARIFTQLRSLTEEQRAVSGEISETA